MTEMLQGFLSSGHGFLACGHHLFLDLVSNLISAILSFTGYTHWLRFKTFHCLGNRSEQVFANQFMQILQQSSNNSLSEHLPAEELKHRQKHCPPWVL